MSTGPEKPERSWFALLGANIVGPEKSKPTWLRPAREVSRTLYRMIAIACMFLFTVLVLAVVWQVIAREVIQNPSVWSEELARYVFVWLGFFGATLLFAERGHIAMDFLIRKLPTRILRGALILVQVAIISFIAVVFVWGGLRYAEQSWSQSLSALPITVGPMFLVMPFTGILIIWFSVLHLIEALTITAPIELLAVDSEDDFAAVSIPGADDTSQDPQSPEPRQEP